MKTATLVDYAFWDSSAIVLLCLHQPDSAAAKRLYAQSPDIILWWGSRIEVKSAIRRAAPGASPAELRAAHKRLVDLTAICAEVQPSEEVRDFAMEVVDRYDLRAADALQLAAALVFCKRFPRGRRFVCFDKKLAAAADLAGFTVLPRV